MLFRSSYQQSLSLLTDSVQDLDVVPVPQGLEAQIMARIAQEATPAQAPVVVGGAARFQWKKYSMVAAVALLVAVVTPLLLNGVQPSGTGADLAARSDKQPEALRTVAMQGKTTDELIMDQAAREKPMAIQQPLPAEESPQGQPQQGGRDQKSRLSAEAPNTIAQAPRKKANNGSAQPVRQARPSKVMIADTQDVDGLHLAYGGTMNMHETFASDTENDVYYDPVSTLVGF